MKSTWRRPAVLTLLAAAGLFGPRTREAQAQTPVYSTRTVLAPTAPVVSSQTVVVPSGPTYVVPTRRIFRNERRYSVLRPNYGGRPALSFAPFSDEYQSRFAAPRPTYYAVPPR